MQKSITKGFTLIELLVVIAIIGILAAIVLVSLGNARQRGADAGIQGNLDSVRTQGEIYASSNNNNYGTVGATLVSAVGNVLVANAATACAPSAGASGMWNDPTIKQALISAQNNAGSATINGAVSVSGCGWGPIGASATTWFIVVPYKSDPTKGWCVDNQGKSMQVLMATYSSAASFQQIVTDNIGCKP